MNLCETKTPSLLNPENRKKYPVGKEVFSVKGLGLSAGIILKIANLISPSFLEKGPGGEANQRSLFRMTQSEIPTNKAA